MAVDGAPTVLRNSLALLELLELAAATISCSMWFTPRVSGFTVRSLANVLQWTESVMSRSVADALLSPRSLDTHLCNATSGKDTPTDGEFRHDVLGYV